MADLHQVNAKYRQALRNREASAVARLTAAYSQAWQTLEEQVTLLAEQLAAEGDEIKKSKLYTLERYRRVQADLERVMGTLNELTEKQIVSDQQAATRLGSQSALDQIRAAFGDDAAEVLQSIELARIPASQLEHLLGMLADGSPLRDALNDLGPTAAQGLEQALINGMTQGVSPQEIARMARDAFGGNLTSALRYSRTASQYAARSAALQHFQENSDVVMGWTWMAALNGSCAACVALHGTVHDLSEPMRSHWSCRCSCAPKVRDSTVEIETGEDWFNRQDAETQRSILGKGGYAAYQEGHSLRKFLGTRDDKTLGKVFQKRSLKEVVGARQARAFTKQAVLSVPSVPARDRSVSFRSAKTLDEAHERLAAYTTVPTQRQNLFTPGLNLDGATFAQMNTALEAADRTLGRYGVQINAIGYKEQKTRSYGVYRRLAADDLVDAVQVQKNVVRNPKQIVARNRKAFAQTKEANLTRLERRLATPTLPELARQQTLAEIERIKTTQRWIVGDDAENPSLAIWVHEFHHALYYRRDLETTWLRELERADQLPRNDDWYRVSEYGASESKELFAEVGTAVELDLDVPDALRDAYLATVKGL